MCSRIGVKPDAPSQPKSIVAIRLAKFSAANRGTPAGRLSIAGPLLVVAEARRPEVAGTTKVGGWAALAAKAWLRCNRAASTLAGYTLFK